MIVVECASERSYSTGNYTLNYNKEVFFDD